MSCHIVSVLGIFATILLHSVSLTGATKTPDIRRYHHHLTDPADIHSQYTPQVIGYNYPGPLLNKPVIVRHETIVASASSQTSNTATAPRPETTVITATTNGPTAKVTATLKVKDTTEEVLSTAQENVGSSDSSATTEETADSRNALDAITTAMKENEHLVEEEQMAQIQKIDVACGKERMTVRITFNDRFDGIIYAKGHYTDPNCRFIGQNSGQKVYQFDMVVGQCGVAYIDSNLFDGGMAYVEGTVVTILEPGVQEAWDAARKVRCIWEGSIDQTVTFPLSINTLDSEILTFNGDTASASLEIQSGRGPRAQPVQGLVRIGELLTVVVTVQGDTDFDLVVRNCIATDGDQNRIILSDNMGCAVKPKLMGGWKKQKTSGNVAAYAYLSAFKFPDVMDLFLECTVSLCKGTCDECPDYLELLVPGQDSESVGNDSSSQNDIGKKPSRTRRSLEHLYNNAQYNETLPAESLRLRRVVHVVGPDDLPDVSVAGLRPTVYGGYNTKDCFSLLGVISTAIATLLLMFSTMALCGIIRRNHREEKW
ncbi:unnamed protein product [Orchesella dallaii]|uniref:ZP domain-containing protein n=1 Tax=Orchesella dallaii TaxID=48710 RepID=A0ABP1QA39_9HEXA